MGGVKTAEVWLKYSLAIATREIISHAPLALYGKDTHSKVSRTYKYNQLLSLIAMSGELYIQLHTMLNEKLLDSILTDYSHAQQHLTASLPSRTRWYWYYDKRHSPANHLSASLIIQQEC